MEKHFRCDGNWWSCEWKSFRKRFKGNNHWHQQDLIQSTKRKPWRKSFLLAPELCTPFTLKAELFHPLRETALETWANSNMYVVHVKQQLKTFTTAVSFFLLDSYALIDFRSLGFIKPLFIKVVTWFWKGDWKLSWNVFDCWGDY